MFNSKGYNRSFLFILPALFLVLVTSQLKAQSATGTWLDSRYNIKLELYANGTYRLHHSNTISQGRFTVNGNNFCLHDQTGSSAVCYTVTGFNAGQLMLRDANGVIMDFRKQGAPPSQSQQPAMPTTGPPQGPRQEPGTQGKNTIAPAQVLAQKGQYSLTGEHFNIGIGLTQFIIGQAVTYQESNELKVKLIEEFNQLPDGVIKQINSIGVSLKQIRTLTNPMQIGYARQQLFVALYQATMHMQEQQKPLMIQVINRYIKVLAHDPVNKLVLTDKDALGMMKYLAFNSEMAGQKIQLTQSVYNSVAAEMVQKFASMPLEQKKVLCSASLMWLMVEHNWNRLTASQKQQYRTAYVAQVQSQYSPAQTNQYTPSRRPNQSNLYNKDGSKKSLQQMQMDMNHRQQMWNIMNRMNLDSHVTSLNIIENMGGSDSYWKVVDY